MLDLVGKLRVPSPREADEGCQYEFYLHLSSDAIVEFSIPNACEGVEFRPYAVPMRTG